MVVEGGIILGSVKCTFDWKSMPYWTENHNLYCLCACVDNIVILASQWGECWQWHFCKKYYIIISEDMHCWVPFGAHSSMALAQQYARGWLELFNIKAVLFTRVPGTWQSWLKRSMMVWLQVASLFCSGYRRNVIVHADFVVPTFKLYLWILHHLLLGLLTMQH